MFGVQLGGFLTQLEVEDIVALPVIGHGAHYVAGADGLPLAHRYGREVAIDRNVAAMTDEHVLGATKLEDRRDLTVEHATCPRPSLTDKVGALVVKTDILETADLIGAEMIAYHIGAGDGYGQASLVLHERAVQLSVLGRKP